MKDIERAVDNLDEYLREAATLRQSGVFALINMVRRELEKVESVSQEWIDEHEIHYNHWVGAVPVTDLQNLLVPKQELPAIPKFVAEFLIGKEDYMLYELFDDEWLYEEHDRVAKWLYDNDELTNKQREIDLVMARDRGYLVEEEQKYYALIKGHENIGSDDKYWNYCITDESLDIGDNKVHADVLAEYVLSATKDEWENLGINDDNADFVEVEELEE